MGTRSVSGLAELIVPQNDAGHGADTAHDAVHDNAKCAEEPGSTRSSARATGVLPTRCGGNDGTVPPRTNEETSSRKTADRMFLLKSLDQSLSGNLFLRAHRVNE